MYYSDGERVFFSGNAVIILVQFSCLSYGKIDPAISFGKITWIKIDWVKILPKQTKRMNLFIQKILGVIVSTPLDNISETM